MRCNELELTVEMVVRAEVGRAPGNDDRGQRRRPAGKTMIAVQGEVLVVKVAWEGRSAKSSRTKVGKC